MNMYLPFKVWTKQETVPSVKEMLADWKKEYLIEPGSYFSITYEKMRKPATPSFFRQAVGFTKAFIKYNWPTLIYVVLAGFLNGFQLFVLSFLGLVLQLTTWCIFLLRFTVFFAVLGVVELEKKNEALS